MLTTAVAFVCVVWTIVSAVTPLEVIYAHAEAALELFRSAFWGKETTKSNIAGDRRRLVVGCRCDIRIL